MRILGCDLEPLVIEVPVVSAIRLPMDVDESEYKRLCVSPLPGIDLGWLAQYFPYFVLRHSFSQLACFTCWHWKLETPNQAKNDKENCTREDYHRWYRFLQAAF